jgi:pyridinium-3,5-bisthiocarboxylic acid mononucleotide nickel chelatase
MKIAYFDCFSGISGDMVLGALLDLGVPLEALLEELGKLPVEGYTISARKERRGAISGTRILIEIGEQPHRHYEDIQNLIRSSGLSERIKEKSLAIFDRIAKAEARVHQVPLSHVHFHEVGALDSILDIVGAVIALEYLGIDRIEASALPLGGGVVKTHHGILPVPAPATVLLLEGLPVYDNGIKRELVTPTGAAILATLSSSFGPVPHMTLASTGYGAGSNPASDPPNLLRVMVGTACDTYQSRRLLLVESNIDDMNPEFYNYVLERLFDLGVLDVGFVPIQMKKNRPGVLLRVLLDPALKADVLDLLFKETTTLGVRIQEVDRVELPREVKSIETPYGPCRVKVAVVAEGVERVVPEYEDCRHIAERHHVPLRKVYEEVLLLAGQGHRAEKECEK